MKITVFVHPNAKKPRVEKDLFGSLHVYVHEPPVEWKANAAVRKVLATYFRTNQSQVLLLQGERSKQKVFEILGNNQK